MSHMTLFTCADEVTAHEEGEPFFVSLSPYDEHFESYGSPNKTCNVYLTIISGESPHSFTGSLAWSSRKKGRPAPNFHRIEDRRRRSKPPTGNYSPNFPCSPSSCSLGVICAGSSIKCPASTSPFIASKQQGEPLASPYFLSVH